MASDYTRVDPAQAFAERRGTTFREGVAEIVRKLPEKVRGTFDGLRLPRADVPEPAALDRKLVKDPEAELRRARIKAIIRHARTVDAIFAADDAGSKGSPEQLRELYDARKAFEEVRPKGRQTPKPLTSRNRSLRAKPLAVRSAVPSRRFS